MGKRYGNVFSDEPLSTHVKEYNENMSKRGGDGEGGGRSYATYLNIEEGETAEVLFLEETPIKFWQHRVYDQKVKKGQGGYRVFSCTRQPDCPLCVAGDTPTFKVAWNVLHIDDEEGPKVKLWVKGIKFAELFEKKAARFDITKERVILERIGKGKNTQYTIDRTNDRKVPKFDDDTVTDLEEYFGLDDEKYNDMERVAKSLGRGGSKRDDDDDDRNQSRGYNGPKKGSRHRADEEEEEEEEEEEKPRGRAASKSKPAKGKSKPAKGGRRVPI